MKRVVRLMFGAAAASTLVSCAGSPTFLSSASSVSQQEADLCKILIYLSIAVFVIVEGILLYSILRFRRRDGDDSPAPQIHGNTRLEIIWTLIPILLVAVLFVLTVTTVQAFEWITLFNKGIGIKDTFGSSFFTVTGIHGTHVFVGIIWAIIVLVSTLRGVYSQQEHRAVEYFGLYWHFVVDIVWIVLFTLIYLV